VIDLHAHVLPGLDDGPRSLDDAVALVDAAGRAGIRTIAATPHVDQRYRVTPDAIAGALADLRRALAARDVGVEVVGGAEIALDRLIDLGPDELAALALGGGGALLVECPLRPSAGDVAWPVRRLLDQGWTVVLAHPERSPAFLDHPALLRELVALGAHAQITASSLAGVFGSLARQSALSWIAAGDADVLATDTHDTERRPPEFEPARRALDSALPALAERWPELTEGVPARVLAARQRGSSGSPGASAGRMPL
jgi:protein-tyrosine phosphatase